MIYQSFQALKIYGKEPEQLKETTGIFNLVLADYPFDKIAEAFAYYLRHNTEFPAPADIALIIERGGNKPPFDRTVYLRLAKRQEADPYAYNVLTTDERQYMKDYERFIVSGKY